MFQALAAAVLFVSLIYLVGVAGAAILAAIRYGGRREDATDDHDALSVSRFTIPVSIIVLADSRSANLGHTLTALLALDYPELEVIVVADRLDEEQRRTLRTQWALEARELFYRRTLATAPVERMFRSTRDDRLVVVEKAAGPRSDALNCGVNLARFRYVCSIEAQMTFDRKALLRAMSAALRDPATVLATSTHIERRTDAPDSSVSADLQRIASARALMDSRLAWRQLAAGLGPTDAVIVWRRDALLQHGGFSPAAADPALEMMARLQNAGAGRVVRSADVFGQAEPVGSTELGRTTGGQLRSSLEVIVEWRRGRRASAGLISWRSLLYFASSAILTPLAMFLAFAATVAAAATGTLPWTDVLLVLIALAFGLASVSNAALLLRGVAPGHPDEDELQRLILLGPLELFCHSPLRAMARLSAVLKA